jgi:glycosyltransferase involved in cell wall biosynthesis
LEQQHESCRGKTKTIYLSFDDKQLGKNARAAEDRDGPLTLLHAGVLYGGAGRNALGLIRGLARAVEVSSECREQVRLQLLGGGRGIPEAVRLAHELGIPEMVVATPTVPASEADQRMAETDVLVVIKFPDPAFNMQIPGKLFRYFGFGKPILGVMGECEASDILRRSRLGIVVSHEDTDGIAHHVLRLLEQRNRLRELYRPDLEYITQFSQSSMAAKVGSLLDSLVREHKNQ